MNVNLKNDLGQVKQVKLGFSWTAFFFGFFVPVFRQDWKWAGIMFGAGLVAGVIANQLNVPYIGLGLNIVWGLLYNKLHVKELLAKGWQPATDFDAEAIRTKGQI